MKILLHISAYSQNPQGLSVIMRMLAQIVLMMLIPALSMADWPEQSEQVVLQNEHLVLKGQAVQGGLLRGELAPDFKIKFNAKAVPVDQQRRFLLALDRDESKSFTLEIYKQAARVASYVVQVKSREYPKQYIEGVEQKYVEPDPAQVARSKRDRKAVMSARQHVQSEASIWQGFIWPVKGPITGVFGSQRVYNGKPRRPHYGVDVARPQGTIVVAPAAGLVTLAEDLYFSGGTLIIDHGHGLSSSFLHLSALHVAVNSRVKQGQVIAEVGATGRVTGAHLDWRMNWTGAGGNTRIDPQLLVPPMDWPLVNGSNTQQATSTSTH